MSAQAKTQRWPLVQQPANRADNFYKDARLLNCFAEKDPVTGEWQVQKRPGYTSFQTLLAGALARGIHTWNLTTTPGATPDCWAIVGNGTNAYAFKNGVQQGSALTDSSQMWSFAEMSGAAKDLVFAGLTSGLYYTSGGAPAAVTEPSGIGSYIVGLAFLDNTAYLMDEKCQIFGSNLNDPTTWDALNLIVAQKVAGNGVGLFHQGAYIIALKTSSMEVFYDAANATGSPLRQIDGSTNHFGCGDRNTLQVIDDTAIYLSSNKGSPQFVQVDNLTPKPISPAPVNRLISLWQSGGLTYSWQSKIVGHRFYGATNTQLNLTLVYDIDQGLWYLWTDSNGNYFPCAGMGLNSSFQHVMLHPSNGELYEMDGDYNLPTDNGVISPVDIYTPFADFGTMYNKVIPRVYFRADRTSGSLLYVRHSNSDYQTWSNFRKVDLGRETPFLDDEGTFVRRAYHLRHASPTAFRIKSMDPDIWMGAR